jgi:IS1 family transposase
MNKLDSAKGAMIVRAVCEGNSLRAASRMTGVAYNTVCKLIQSLGEACEWYQDKNLRNLPCTELQLDEAWAFVGCKEANKNQAKGEHIGDIWTWIGMDPNTKLVAGYYVGDRSANTAVEFCSDLGTRFSGHIQVTSDGHAAYRFAVGLAFKDVDFAQLVKVYGEDKEGNEIVVRCDKVTRFGNPDMDKVSTSLIERQNLTLRMSCRCYARRTNAHSKKIENHCNAVALHFFFYNFCRKHLSLKTSPAVAAGVASSIWTVDDLLEMFDTYQAVNHAPKRPAKYQPRRKPPITPTPKDQIPTPWYLDMKNELPEKGLIDDLSN